MKTTEFELIREIKNNLMTTPVDMIQGIGEDCAVVKKDEKHVFLISTDCLIERVHFDLDDFSFLEVGKKAMSVNLSDIAAMAGKPLYAFVTIGIPSHFQKNDIRDFYTGLEQVSQEFSTAIIGGDTSRSPNLFFISLTVIGVAKNGAYKLRSSAKSGDGIYISGPLGSSAVGLTILKKKKKLPGGTDYIQAHKNPRPRIPLATILSNFSEVHAMIDVSDGLLQDLDHILQASEVRARLDYNEIPKEKDFDEICERFRLSPEETLLSGGEDYELLFTMDESALDSLQKELNHKKLFIKKIGTILPLDQKKPGVEVVRDGETLSLQNLGYDHFA